jgi:hypothetical protein
MRTVTDSAWVGAMGRVVFAARCFLLGAQVQSKFSTSQ